MDTEDKLIRLLIVEEDFHKAEQITSSLRATGIQVRAEFAEDDEDMTDMLARKDFDLVLFSTQLPEFTLAQGCRLLVDSEKHIGLIALIREENAGAISEAIATGALDAAATENTGHLIQVIRREADHVGLWRQAKRLELELQESEKRCQSLLANSLDAVAYVHEGMHIFANQAYMDLFGHTDFAELEGTPLIDMVESSQQDELKSFLRKIAQQRGEAQELDLKLIHSSGEVLETRLEFAPASYDGEPCTQLLIRSTSATSELEQQIHYLHQHDLVSGLYNRQYFMDELKTALGQAVNGKQQYAVVYISIDNFQSVRDAVGISGCDVLIGDVARIISANAGERFTVARFGAHSYACLGKPGQKHEVEAFAAKVPELVEQHICEIGDQTIAATCSAAVVFIDENSPDNPNSIISRAEKTCDEVQQQGGNGSKTYILKAGEITQEEEDSITAGLIKDALNHSRIKALYQPIVGVKGQGGERYQSSILINNAEGRELREADYREPAERTGTARMLDRWKILHAIKKVSETARKGRKIEFFIPLSADSIQDAGLPLWVSENITKAKIDGHQLVFMLNETQLLSQLKAAKNLTAALKQFKCQFAIDEFGAGLNPFQLVKHIDADYVRINHDYMNGLMQNNDNQQNIRELTERATEIELKTITPSVEDASVLSVLWTLNVDFIQGNFLQEPQPELNFDFSSM